MVVVDDTDDYTKLTTDGWVENDFSVFVTKEIDRLSTDFKVTEPFDTLPIFSLIDAKTGKVIYPDCYTYPQPNGIGEGNLAGCIRDHL